MPPDKPELSSLTAVTPLDGRYNKTTEPLAPYFSDKALIKYRIIVEGEYLRALSNVKGVKQFQPLSLKNLKIIRSIYNLSNADAEEVRRYDSITNHDVKAMEYFMRDKLKAAGLEKILEWMHFALTSEDVNNLAYAMMLSESIRDVMIPTLDDIIKTVEQFAKKYKNLAMLARTHGQPASPTTFGKEFKVFAVRLKRQRDSLKNYKILVKFNGATGNYNAHVAAFPKVSWVNFTKNFIQDISKFRKINLEPSLITTQIESNDTYAELFDNIRRINTILIGFNQDLWRYISDNWIILKPLEGEVGSSTMPHKVNPLDFEKSEGNLGMANALLTYFSTKLPIARLQRDLTDSTVERNLGVAFAYSLVAYKATLRGLGLIAPHERKITEELENHPEVVAEAIQTVLRREGVPIPYEKLKTLTRGKKVTMKDFAKFIDKLEIDPKVKKELKRFTPKNYVGIANKL